MGNTFNDKPQEDEERQDLRDNDTDELGHGVGNPLDPSNVTTKPNIKNN
ncbi:hypothetical protein [Luteibacter yeojuensis]|nr:hypothetical protein [Luteibacter yeojuensis]